MIDCTKTRGREPAIKLQPQTQNVTNVVNLAEPDTYVIESITHGIAYAIKDNFFFIITGSGNIRIRLDSVKTIGKEFIDLLNDYEHLKRIDGALPNGFGAVNRLVIERGNDNGF